MTNKSRNEQHTFAKNKHLSAAMVKPFISGSRVQLERYIAAQRLASDAGISGVWTDRCLYELSSLFEHLATVAVYLKLSGFELPIMQPIIDIRHHIRHDAREEVDKDDERTRKRGERLGLNPKLQVGIEFIDNGVKVGTTELKATEISLFLDMAENAAYAMLMGVRIEMTGTDT